MNAVRAVLLTALCLGIAGCGGPGSISEPRATARLAVDPGQATRWINDYRRAHGLALVTDDPTLNAVAQAQADAMAAGNQLSHTIAGPLPRRLAVVGRGNGAAAENVSAGYADLLSALGGWRRSPEHDKNLLYAPIRRIGVAAAEAPGTRYKTFWALVMTD